MVCGKRGCGERGWRWRTSVGVILGGVALRHHVDVVARSCVVARISRNSSSRSPSAAGRGSSIGIVHYFASHAGSAAWLRIILTIVACSLVPRRCDCFSSGVVIIDLRGVLTLRKHERRVGFRGRDRIKIIFGLKIEWAVAGKEIF